MPEEIVFRMVLDASDLQRIMSVGPGQVAGGAGPAVSGGAGGGGAERATPVRPDPSFMSIFKPLVALEAIKVGITTLVENSQVMSTYLGAFKKIIGAAVDLLLAPLTPFLNVAMLFMTTLLQALVESGIFQEMLAWSQSIAKDMATWITEHAPAIKAAVRKTVEILSSVVSVLGNIITTIVTWWSRIYNWLDTHLGPVGGLLKGILKYTTIAAGVMATGLIPGPLGMPGRLAFGAARGIGGVGAGAIAGRGLAGGLFGGGAMSMLGLGAAGIGAGFLGSTLMQKGGAPNWAAGAMGMGLAGAGIGAAIGLPFGGIGAVPGAAIGGGIGLLAGGTIGAVGAMGGLGNVPGIGTLFGGGTGGGGGKVDIKNSGNVEGSHNVINIDQHIDGGGEEAAREAVDALERELGGTSFTRS